MCGPARAQVDTQLAYKERLGALQSHPVQSDDIVFLGDSLIARGQWSDWLDDDHVRNFGIGHDVISALLRRLSMVTRAEPRAIILQIGTNDVLAGAPVPSILAYYETLLVRIRTETPSTLIVVMSLPPKWPQMADRVWRINQGQRKLAASYGALFVDQFEPFRDRYGAMDRDFSPDLVHFSGRGYREVVHSLEGAMDILKGGVQ